MSNFNIDLERTLNAQRAYDFYKFVVANLNSFGLSQAAGLKHIKTSPVEGRKDLVWFQKAADEFGYAKFWVFYIMVASLRGNSVYIRDLMTTQKKDKYMLEVSAFFDNPARWTTMTVRSIKDALEAEAFTKLKKDLLTQANPLAYAWVTSRLGVDFLRSDDVHVNEFKRKIKMISELLTLNSDVESVIRSNIEKIGA